MPEAKTHKKMERLMEHKHRKLLLVKSSRKITKKVPKFNRKELRLTTGLVIDCCDLRKHLSIQQRNLRGRAHLETMSHRRRRGNACHF